MRRTCAGAIVALAMAGVIADAMGGGRMARADAAAPQLDEALYAQLLERHTAEVPDLAGVRVDYAGLRDSAGWRRLVASLAEADLAALPTRAERLAFWINAYNILAIDVVRRSYPVDSIRDVGSLLRPVWKRDAGVVGGRTVSLDEVEHRILRPMGEPRVHAAIVCASLSCPPLRREPYRAATLEAQLDDALRSWLADPRKGARYERETGTLHLSPIFDWFAEDFSAKGGVLPALRPYLSQPIRDALAARADAPRIAYLDYDWRLNDLARAPKPAGAARAGGAG